MREIALVDPKIAEAMCLATGDIIAAVVNTAAMASIKEKFVAGRKDTIKVTMTHFEKAMQKVNRKNKAIGSTSLTLSSS